MRTPGIIATTLALALALSGCATAEPAETADAAPTLLAPQTIRATIDDERVRLDTPIGTPRGLAVWFHGQGSDEDSRMGDNWLDALRAAGWYVASGTTGRVGWGNPESIVEAQQLIEWAQSESGFDATLYIAGSMGGLTSLGLMLADEHSPRCWYGTMPVTDLTAVERVPGSAQQISHAWGDTPLVSPIDYALELDLNVTYKFRYSPDDVLVPADSNSIPMAAKLRAAGAEVLTSEASGDHGHASHFDVFDLATFALDCTAPVQ